MGVHILPRPEHRKQPPVDQGGAGGDNADMEARVAKLEDFALDTRDRLVRIETRMENFENNFATKADLHKEINAQTWKFVTWMTGICTALIAVTYFIAHNVK